MFFLLPHGMPIGGVTTWAFRLIRELRAMHREAYILAPGDAHLLNRSGIDPEWFIPLGDLPALDQTRADLSQWINACDHHIASRLKGQTGLWLPQQLGEGVSLGLELARRHDLRTVWVSHSDIPYNRLIARTLGPWLDAVVGVSDELGAGLLEDLAETTALVRTIHNGVPVDEHPPQPKEPDDTLRLIAVGRVEHEPKRVTALAHLSRQLEAMEIPHCLTIVGDGPAMDDLRALATGSMHLTGSLDTEGVNQLLSQSHLFVQASRYEGLSLSMLEAMAQGVVPVVTPVRSGLVIEDGVSGIIAPVSFDASPQEAGEALCEGVIRAQQLGIADLSTLAWRVVRNRFSLAKQAESFCTLFDELTAMPQRLTRPPAIFGTPGMGSVPIDAFERALAVFASLAGKPFALHGTGAHTRALADALDLPALGVVALIDDDPTLHNSTRFGLPVLSPDRAHTLGIGDVVISSHLHEQQIWARREIYLRQGITLHRLYADSGTSSEPLPLSDARAIGRSPEGPSASTTASAEDAADTAA